MASQKKKTRGKNPHPHVVLESVEITRYPDSVIGLHWEPSSFGTLMGLAHARKFARIILHLAARHPRKAARRG